MATIGQVNTIYLVSNDQMNTRYETNITGRNITVNYDATYQQVDTTMRALNALTTNTYQDTLLIKTVSVNEVLQEEEDG